MPASGDPGGPAAPRSSVRRVHAQRHHRATGPHATVARTERSQPEAAAEAPSTGTPGTGSGRFRWRRAVVWALVVALVLPLLWYGFALFDVWRAGRTDEAGPAQAIIVLGAAQYDGRPSPVLESRLQHALDLWRQGLAPYLVVTGGRQPGDRFTEATASADWLLDRGVPDDAILREVQGATTWESLAASARFLQGRGITDVVIVSDPYHLLRAEETAEEVGLEARTSPVPDSLVTGWAEKRRMLKEAAGVAVARLPFVGYRRLLQLTG